MKEAQEATELESFPFHSVIDTVFGHSRSLIVSSCLERLVARTGTSMRDGNGQGNMMLTGVRSRRWDDAPHRST